MKEIERHKGEIKELKRMLQTPRLHFKAVEQADWDSLATQQKAYDEKASAYTAETGIKKEKARAKGTLKTSRLATVATSDPRGARGNSLQDYREARRAADGSDPLAEESLLEPSTHRAIKGTLKTSLDALTSMTIFDESSIDKVSARQSVKSPK